MNDVPTRLLRESLRDAAGAASSNCVTSDTLAAFADDALGARERAAVEEHAASCERCQALLAAMVRTSPSRQPLRVVSPIWRFAWIAPVAATLAAVAIWVGSPPRSTPAPAQTISVAPAPNAGSREGSRDAATTTTAKSAAAPVEREPPGSNLAARADRKTPSAVSVPPEAPGAESQPRVEQQAAELRDAAPTSSPVAPPLPIPSPTVPTPTAAVPPAAAPSNAAPVNGAARFALGARAGSAPKARAETTADIVTPDARVRWRLLASGFVARSEDGGTTWQTQTTGLPAVLAASAPSADVCWVIGPAGGVALTIDGHAWHTTALPERVDAVAVRASDARNAAVTLGDGRVLVTSDAGKSWR